MKNSTLVRTLIFAAAALALALASHAQEPPQSSTSASSSARKDQSKKPKVWTEDNISSVRSPADNYVDEEQAQAALRAEAKKAATAPATPAKEAKLSAPPALSNPKTVDSADKMIAWEDRDIAAQTEFVAKLQAELAQAPPGDQQRLQNLIRERQKIVADTQAERQALVDQKKDLEKKAATPKSGTAPDSKQ
jgi:hypothetical protein